jgi:hypothetical protein
MIKKRITIDIEAIPEDVNDIELSIIETANKYIKHNFNVEIKHLKSGNIKIGFTYDDE